MLNIKSRAAVRTGPASLLAGSMGRSGQAESRPMTSDALRARAWEGFRTAGRGVVVTLDDQDEVRYSTIEDLRGALADAPELAGLVEVVGAMATPHSPLSGLGSFQSSGTTIRASSPAC